MTDHDAALRLLLEAFPESEGWSGHFVEQPPDYKDRWFAHVRKNGRRVPDCEIAIEGECCPSPLAAAQDCIRARDQLVADACRAEREACAKVCDDLAEKWKLLLAGYRNRATPSHDDIETATTQAQTYMGAAAAIRAHDALRGATK